jgi:hypothetical protein
MNRVMSIEERLEAIQRLGLQMADSDSAAYLGPALELSQYRNTWFTDEFLLESIRGFQHLINSLNPDRIISSYGRMESRSGKIAILSAGNIPAVAFHDLLCVWISGYKAIVRLSKDDDVLLPALQKELEKVEPRYCNSVSFTTERADNFDAVIATGSSNTARYYNYYFSRWPHIIRKNRNGTAVLDGNETMEELKGLSRDICLYWGLGCRNVSKVYVPEGYDFGPLAAVLEKEFGHLRAHSKYANNIDYQRAVLMLSSVPFIDAGPVLFRQGEATASPLSILHFATYKDISALGEELSLRSDEIQCVIGKQYLYPGALPYGEAQSPAFFDYADGVDVMNFLAGLN